MWGSGSRRSRAGAECSPTSTCRDRRGFGKYGVDLDAFERLALTALEPPPGGATVIDELGKMELASERFREAVTALFDADVPLVATVQVFRHPFADALKRRPEVDVIKLSRANRDELPEVLAARLSETDPDRGGAAARRRPGRRPR